MSALLQRLCWNTRGWTAPSGGKFGTENSYPGRYGFGHEEWNLNTADAVDGYVYGHIYRDYESLGKHTVPGPHDIYFWSRQKVTSPPILIGVYHRAVFVPFDERIRVTKALESRGILARRAGEILSLGLPAQALARIGSPLDQLRGGGFAVLRVKKDDIEIPAHSVLLSTAFKGRPLPTLTRYYQFARLDEGTAGEYSGKGGKVPPSSRFDEAARVDAYWRQTTAGNRRIVKHEEILRAKLITFLKEDKRPAIFTSEVGHTDLTAERNGHVCLMELKTCRHVQPRIAARAALGQLLYYAYHKASGSPFANARPPDSLCIVLDDVPDTDTRTWLSELAKRLGIVIDLAWNSGQKFSAAFSSTPFF